MYRKIFYLWIILMLMSCVERNKDNATSLDYNLPPEWARKAIWYQIFVERFRNGNPANDPTLATCDNALIDKVPSDWSVTPWGHNWYQQESWAKPLGLDFYRTIQMRRYGGDLAGVEEKIPYLKDLGITAIYFNPVNDAPSLHKYDARSYHHVDVTFGDDIDGDLALMSKEDPSNPDTWVLTSADKKFFGLVRQLHEAGIKVILDFSWNHTGNNFWAFKDIEKNLDKSKYKDWYTAEFIEDKSSGKTILKYDGWVGIKNLPELKKINSTGKIPGHPYDGNLQDEVKQHIFDVSKKYMDPYKDGSLKDGIDGMRLDVAEHVPLGFWKDFRKYVRSVNSEFYLVGENWWTKWPDELMDPAPWVKGDIFDAVMHYQWFKISRGYFAQPDDRLNLNQFKRGLDSVFLKYPDYTQQAMMNLGASHDSPRLLTSFYNGNKYKFKCKSQEDGDYLSNKPDEHTYHQVKLFLIHQFTFVGAPHIWNGDEMGMFGADDPDNRKPLCWPDIDFDMETQSDFSNYKYAAKLSFDHNMFDFYKSLIALRKENESLSLGDYTFKDIEGDNILAYERKLGDEKILVVFNNNGFKNIISLPEEYKKRKLLFSYRFIEDTDDLMCTLPPFSAIVIKIK